MSLTENGKHLCLNVCFEDFLLQPSEVFQQILDFVGLDCSEEDTHALITEMDASRAYVFKQDMANNMDFEALKNDPLVQKLGYAECLVGF